MITIENFRYETATSPYSKQQVIDHPVPADAVYRKNSIGHPPRVLLYYNTNDTKTYCIDIYGVIKSKSPRKYINKYYVSKILTPLVRCSFNTIDEIVEAIIPNL